MHRVHSLLRSSSDQLGNVINLTESCIPATASSPTASPLVSAAGLMALSLLLAGLTLKGTLTYRLRIQTVVRHSQLLGKQSLISEDLRDVLRYSPHSKEMLALCASHCRLQP
jgi:hypothetical protein